MTIPHAVHAARSVGVPSGAALRCRAILAATVLAGGAVLAGCAGDEASGESGAQSSSSDAAVVSGNDLGSDRHPTGMSIRVHDIAVRDASIAVAVTVVNGNSHALPLNSRGLALVDNFNGVYMLKAPEQNGKLQIPSGGKLTGTLVFLGELTPGAKTVTLRTNVDRDEAATPVDLKDRSDTSSYPVLQVPDMEIG